MKDWLLFPIFLVATQPKIKTLESFTSGSLLLCPLDERKSVSLHDEAVRIKLINRSSWRADGSIHQCTSHDVNTSCIGYFPPSCEKMKMPEKVTKGRNGLFWFVVWETVYRGRKAWYQEHWAAGRIAPTVTKLGQMNADTQLISSFYFFFFFSVWEPQSMRHHPHLQGGIFLLS